MGLENTDAVRVPATTPDKYQTIRRLAVGGMGEIFLARQTGTAGFDRVVILKTLLPDLAKDADEVTQFLNEARVAATLNHPNIVSIYEVGQMQGTYFIAMEYIRGDNVSRLLRASEDAGIVLPCEIMAFIVRDAALGLHHAHHAKDAAGQSLDVVHRDVSPQNIMVRDDGVAKVVDFGIAHVANRGVKTQTGLVKGKPQYMSPEQIGGKRLDGRSDLFSLGVLLWESTTQRQLFHKDNVVATINAIMNEPVPPPSSFVPNYPAELEHIVMKMLAREREERFSTCGEAAEVLSQYLANVETPVTQKEVAGFVDHLLGAEIDERTQDLTPSAVNIFTPTPMSFSATHANLGETINIDASSGSRSSAARIGLFVTGAALMLAAAVFVMVWGNTEAPAPPKTVEPTPVELLSIEVTKPVGASVIVDGTLWKEKVPTTVTGLTPGPHDFELKLPGKPALKKRVVMSKAPKALKVIRLKPPAEGMVLDIREPPGAQVIVDGKPWPERVPTVVTGLSKGLHQVRLQPEGLPSVEKSYFLKPDTPVIVQEAAPKKSMVLDLREPRGAIVTINGSRWREPVPTNITGLPPGAHQIKLALPGHEAIEKQITLKANEPLIVAEPMPAKLAIAPPRRRTVAVPSEPQIREVAVEKKTGFLNLNTKPWTQVSIDGRRHVTTPVFRLELPVGQHVLRFVNAKAGIDEKRKVTIRDGQVSKMNLKLGG